MPMGSPKRRLRKAKSSTMSSTLDSFASTSSSWADLEVQKGKTASVMDRVEYLASTSNLFTDFRAREAKNLNNDLRHTIQGGGRQNLTLTERIGKSKSDASLVLDAQKERLTKGGTMTRRADALTRYIVSSERTKNGKLGSEAAKTSAKGSTFQMLRDYPLYNELYKYDHPQPGAFRESMMAVSIRMPFVLSEKARYHGSPKPAKKTEMPREESDSEPDEED